MGIPVYGQTGERVQDSATETHQTGSALQGYVDELGRRSTGVPGTDTIQLKPRQTNSLRMGVCPACDNMLNPLSKVCSSCQVNWSDECHVAMRQRQDSTTVAPTNGHTVKNFVTVESWDVLQEAIRTGYIVPGTVTIGDPSVTVGDGSGSTTAFLSETEDQLQMGSKGATKTDPSPPFTRQDLFHLHERICKDALDLMVKKNQDYAGGHSQDPFGNFRKSTMLGIDPVVGILLRVLDKFSRLESFIESGTLAVKDEPVDDIFRDVVNYMVLAAGLVEEQRRLSPKS